MADNQQPIIIKKIKKSGGGHHGGAWKVAYADFVTAMMAFFLLMWLLSSTTQEQKAGLADYFTPTTGLKDAKGIGFKGGQTPNQKGESKNSKAAPGLVVGQVPQGPVPKEPIKTVDNKPKDDSQGQPNPAVPGTTDESLDKENSTGDKGDNDADNENFKRIEEQIMNAVEQSPELNQIKNNIVITHTPEGLKIDVVDDQNRPMFVAGSAVMTEIGRNVLKTIGGIVGKTDNKVALAGHTDASTTGTNPNYSSWELSADRANNARKFLMQTNMDPERVSKVTGMSDRDLLVPNEPNSPRNRRISLTLLRGTHVKAIKAVPTGRGLLTETSSPTTSTEAPAGQ